MLVGLLSQLSMHVHDEKVHDRQTVHALQDCRILRWIYPLVSAQRGLGYVGSGKMKCHLVDWSLLYRCNRRPPSSNTPNKPQWPKQGASGSQGFLNRGSMLAVDLCSLVY